MSNFSLDDLNRLYSEAEESSKETFAEMRSNVLLVSGKHYANFKSNYWSRIKSNTNVDREHKIKIVNNWTQKITKTYVNAILSRAPSTSVFPNNENELQDQKAAELGQAVWSYAKETQNLRSFFRRSAKDFIEIGEAACKIYFDPNKGNFIGYMEEQTVDEAGNVLSVKKIPQFTGRVEIERIMPWDLLMDPAAKSPEDARYVIYRKLVDLEEIKPYIKSEEDFKKLEESKEDTFQVFNSSRSQYETTKGKTLVRELYYRPCTKYPNGYFVISTQNMILAEGELPAGIFPIVFKECEEASTLPRGVSIVRTIRPYQSQINYASSSQLRHILTLGDDKVFTQKGTTISKGATYAGIRHFRYSGLPPTIQKGSDGSQHMNYKESIVGELLRVLDLEELLEDKKQTSDAYQELYKNMKQKQRFNYYSSKFEEYIIDVTKLYLELAKIYLNETHLVPAIGRSELINISEFKNTSSLCTQVKIQSVDDDIDSAFGKSLALSQTLQYVGSQMEKEDIGKLLKAHPFLNKEQILGDMTTNYTSATDAILALDRGEWVEPHKYDDHPYLIRRLVDRTRKSDFKLLPLNIQELYQRKISQHMELEKVQADEIRAAQADFIPTGGFMVACDFYVQNGEDPSKTKRVRLPSESIDWLVKRMEQQGSHLERLEQLQEGAQQEIAQKMLAGGIGMPQGNSASVIPMNPYTGMGEMNYGN